MFMPKVASACTSNASASSVGAVDCPSGHQLWSSHPEAKSGAPFSCSVLAPPGASPSDTVRMPKYDVTSSTSCWPIASVAVRL